MAIRIRVLDRGHGFEHDYIQPRLLQRFTDRACIGGFASIELSSRKLQISAQVLLVGPRADEHLTQGVVDNYRQRHLDHSFRSIPGYNSHINQ